LPPDEEPPEPPLPPAVLSDEQPYTERPSTKNGTAARYLIDITDAPCQMEEERRVAHLLPPGKNFASFF
jgi:hypothetical protein